MIFAFQDYDNLYLVMDLLNGGDLSFHLCKLDVFNERQSSTVYIHTLINHFINRIFYRMYFIRS